MLVANFPGVDPAVPVRLAARLRAAGIGAEVFPDPIQIGKQMGYGSTRGHKLAVIVGPDEQAQRGIQPPQPRHPRRSRRESPGPTWNPVELASRTAHDDRGAIEGTAP